MNKKVLHTDLAPKAIGPYVQGIRLGDMVYLSGMLGLDPKTGELAGGAEAQTIQSMKNIGEVLATEGMSYENIVKTTIFVKDLADFATVNKAYESFLNGSFPATISGF